MAPLLREQAVLPEDPDVISSTYICNSSPKECNSLLWPPWTLHTFDAQIHVRTTYSCT